MLEAQIKALRLWSDDRKADVDSWARDERVRHRVESLVALARRTGGDGRALWSSPARAELDALLAPMLQDAVADAFSVIEPSGRILATRIPRVRGTDGRCRELSAAPGRSVQRQRPLHPPVLRAGPGRGCCGRGAVAPRRLVRGAGARRAGRGHRGAGLRVSGRRAVRQHPERRAPGTHRGGLRVRRARRHALREPLRRRTCAASGLVPRRAGIRGGAARAGPRSRRRPCRGAQARTGAGGAAAHAARRAGGREPRQTGRRGAAGRRSSSPTATIAGSR